MKRLTTLLMLLIAMTIGSQQTFSQTVTITLNPGWTWISYSRADTLDFATALGTFTPMEGDIIKSQYGFAMYQEGQWSGGISHFYPGLGYMYRSMRTIPTPISFGQPASQVIVTTAEPIDITTNSATCGGEVTNTGNSGVLVRGVCWSTQQSPTVDDPHTTDGYGTGSFTCAIEGLEINTTYYIRAYAMTTTGTCYGNEVNFTTENDNNAPTGAINGLFSVSATKQVYFSQGNLQYIGSVNTPYWKFADNQWDYIGATTGQGSGSQSYDRDLFGWGTSGYNHGAVCYQPWNTSTNTSDYKAYGQPAYNLYDLSGDADWGYNSITNGGNQENSGWRTLTDAEWKYVFETRATSSGIRYAKARVNNVFGVILLPDNWNASYYTLNSTNSGAVSFSSNVISASQWSILEQYGAVFLPVAGRRNGSSVSDVGLKGYYWSSKAYYNLNSNPAIMAYHVRFDGSSLVYDWVGSTSNQVSRYFGESVRLVRDAE